MGHIRFFYSEKELLESLKSTFYGDSHENVDSAKNILHINFCLDIPLKKLEHQSLNYFISLCTKYREIEKISSLEYFDLLDAIFYLFASEYDFWKKNEEISNLLNFLKTNIIVNNDDELENYSKIYLSLIIDYINTNYFNKKFAVSQINVLENLRNQFEGLINEDNNILYEVIATDLSNVNRMKNIYLNTIKPKTVGYHDFNNMFATLGKIRFWKIIGIKLDINIINNLFINEFGKKLNYFDF